MGFWDGEDDNTPALILAFSPGEKEWVARVSGFAEDYPANPAHEFSGGRRTILLLLGEKAGMREDIHLNYSFGFSGRV